MELDHIALIVSKEENLAFYEKLGFKEKNRIRLQPENHTMDPIIVPDCKILGKVAGVFRKM